MYNFDLADDKTLKNPITQNQTISEKIKSYDYFDLHTETTQNTISTTQNTQGTTLKRPSNYPEQPSIATP